MFKFKRRLNTFIKVVSEAICWVTFGLNCWFVFWERMRSFLEYEVYFGSLSISIVLVILLDQSVNRYFTRKKFIEGLITINYREKDQIEKEVQGARRWYRKECERDFNHEYNAVFKETYEQKCKADYENFFGDDFEFDQYYDAEYKPIYIKRRYEAYLDAFIDSFKEEEEFLACFYERVYFIDKYEGEISVLNEEIRAIEKELVEIDVAIDQQFYESQLLFDKRLKELEMEMEMLIDWELVQVLQAEIDKLDWWERYF